MAPLDLPSSTDVVFVDTLRVSANIGRDWWGKARAQPIEITVYLHLEESYLQTSGKTDNVLDSVHYGHLTKTISTLIKERSSEDEAGERSSGFADADDLIQAVSERAFDLAGDAASEVRVVLGVPKMILLASGFSVDTTIAKGPPHFMSSKNVSVNDIVLPVIIGVNPPEREEKQRVIINITFHENTELSQVKSPDYKQIVSGLCKEIEPTSYLTLEKFVMEIVRFCCLSSDKVAGVTARAQKPSALSFAQSSGVQITRTREIFL
ncbi:Folic acid synthesis protein fol1 [Psilocybe cubensis]|uniref:dihydroneopterin aldolase n=2 Tax=Psilocybe cubensis TaxID=181762 RepID=A0A8H8CJA4_PSICU|nr:Folic acid synthesis protein fol1 [Psilocybe cubensis]KAH9476757.1 Folic acid synthesis protein fol1 [Psilocybe cubensis]